MNDIRKINEKLYVGTNERGISYEISQDKRGDMKEEVWCLYIDLSDRGRGSYFVDYTETLLQTVDLARALKGDEVLIKDVHPSTPMATERDVCGELISTLDELSNNDIPNTSACYRLGYLAALGDMRIAMDELTDSEFTFDENNT